MAGKIRTNKASRLWAVCVIMIGISLIVGCAEDNSTASTEEVKLIEGVDYIRIAPNTETMPTAQDRYGVRSLKEDENVRWIRGIVYGQAKTFKGTKDLLLDLYLPKEAQSPTPVVLWIHGGGWENGTRNNPRTPWVVRHGYAIVSIEYRLSGEAHWPAQIEDCKSAVRWLKANAKQYNLDGERICAIGGSAGAHLATMLAVTCGVESLEKNGENQAESSCVQGAVNLFGPTDLLAHARRTDRSKWLDYDHASRKLIGSSYKDAPEKYAQASVTSYITPDDPPILTVHGSKDATVPFEQAILLHKKLKQVGVENKLYELVGVGHSAPPDSFWVTEEAQQRVLNYLEKYL
ncbi:MAG: alpha/beta hydrolase [Planctomycetes bacterium]|nr:alpha/beta hydrolase [Planctomycetota bacterium]